MSMGMELGGIALGLIGWIISIITCALPMWKVTAFVGANIVTAPVIWEGIWMTCVVHSTGQMQCKIYDSMLAFSQDLQAARAMCIVSIILGMLAVTVSIMGAKCTNCIKDEASKARFIIVSGICFIISGILTLIPVSWTSSTIVQDFYNTLVPRTQRRELGASLYIGFAAAAFLIIGGALLCCTCPPRENSYKPPKKHTLLLILPVATGRTMYKILLKTGWIISIITCALPMWKVTAFVGANIVTAQVTWEGIWMSCVVQSTGQIQCKIYDSILALPQDLQAARAMCIVSIILSMQAVLISIMGVKCTNCIKDEASKAKVMIVSGIFFIISGILTLIAVFWTSNTVVQDFYNPLVPLTQRMELGASLYIGYGAAAFLIIGGALLCCTCPPRENSYKPPKKAYIAPRSASGYGKDYV
ncbi:claudin-3 [Silurus asotus]|uniref:Claudin-3 n=1 Tax=Silurus asotus TaxID=30991 RepID=A0AAD5AVJ3_SILAS|nr:claudin-3 [Silurus asotus]